jgi:hypothetical protein
MGRSILVGLLVTAAACSGKDPYNPGTKLGTFHVSAKLTSSTCGAAPSPWEFDVRIHHDGTTLYWVQGGAPIEGRVGSDAKARLEAETLHDVRAADRKRGACAMSRKDVLEVGLVDAASQPTRDPSLAAAFDGTLAYAFTPTQGSECEDQLVAVGGGFEARPCAVHYALPGRSSHRNDVVDWLLSSPVLDS